MPVLEGRCQVDPVLPSGAQRSSVCRGGKPPCGSWHYLAEGSNLQGEVTTLRAHINP